MTDIESKVAGALRMQAGDALRADPPVASDVVLLTDYLSRPAPRRGGAGVRLGLAASVAAVAVGALAVGLTFVATGGSHHATTVAKPMSSATSLATPSATASATAANPFGLAPGQYLHVHTAPIETKDTSGHPFTQAGAEDTWIPAETNAEYVYVDHSDTPAHRVEAVCGPGMSDGCSARYLPTDPATLRAKLARAGSDPGRFAGTGDAVWETGNFFVDYGLAPRAVVLAMVDVLKALPGVTVSHHVANGAGQYGDALTYHPGHIIGGGVYSLIYDPATGRVLGTGQAASPSQALQLDPVSYEVTTKTG